MRHELFIYYRAKLSDDEALAAAVRAVQRELVTRFAGLEARVLRRADVRDGDTTWMEIYRLPIHANVAALTAAIESASQALQPWLVGSRHVEHFVPCA